MNCTLTLSDEVGRKIQEIVKPYGGTVTSYARHFLNSMAELDENQRKQVHEYVAKLLEKGPATKATKNAPRQESDLEKAS